MNIINEFKLAFIKNKKLILVISLIFIISLILGFIFNSFLNNIFDSVIKTTSSNLKNGIIHFTFKDIFLHNLLILLKIFIFGFIFCISTLILIYNGFFFGYFIAFKDPFRTLVLTLPHGVFEFSSMILATVSGILLFKYIFYLFKSRPWNNLEESLNKNQIYLKQSLLILFVAIVLMFIAAIIEVYITLPFGRFIFSLFN